MCFNVGMATGRWACWQPRPLISAEDGEGNRTGSVQLPEWSRSFGNVDFAQRTNKPRTGGWGGGGRWSEPSSAQLLCQLHQQYAHPEWLRRLWAGGSVEGTGY